MDNEQLTKRVEWLDEERRADKSTIAELQKRIVKLEGLLEKSNSAIGELSSEVTRMGVLMTKVNEFEAAMKAHRGEVQKELGEQDKQAKAREREAKKMLQVELDSSAKTLEEMSNKIGEVAKLKNAMETRKAEEMRLEHSIGEIRDTVSELRNLDEERNRMVRSLEESHRMDTKRVTDMQGEVAALRKRSDEFRGQIELALDSQRNFGTRINELLAGETERREAQNDFTQKWTLELAQQEKSLKGWEKRFSEIDKLAEELNARLQAVSISERDVKRAQETFEEITGQLNRRINEITEMQRLGEERFRQEWATFKAEDQKRWTNYVLSQEELQGESNRKLGRLLEQMTNLEDNLQELQDVVQHLSEQSEKRLQTLLANVRDWVTENERFLGSTR